MSVGISSLLNTKAFDRKVLALTTAAVFVYLLVFAVYDRKTLSRKGMIAICSVLLAIETAGMAVYGFSENGQVLVTEYFRGYKRYPEGKGQIQNRSGPANGTGQGQNAR